MKETMKRALIIVCMFAIQISCRAADDVGDAIVDKQTALVQLEEKAKIAKEEINKAIEKEWQEDFEKGYATREDFEDPLFYEELRKELEVDENKKILAEIHKFVQKAKPNDNRRKLEAVSERGFTFFRAPEGKSLAQKTECNTYKIHLMPKNYNTDVVYDIMKALETAELISSVALYKFSYHDLNSPNPHQHSIVTRDVKQKREDETLPDIVLYTYEKENAQRALNALFEGTKHIEGSGIRPRHNAKVNDLIWVAQGNADNKVKLPWKRLFQEDLIYCKPTFDANGKRSDTPVDHYLVHPETGEPLISP